MAKIDGPMTFGYGIDAIVLPLNAQDAVGPVRGN